jgi:hypothetical protein
MHIEMNDNTSLKDIQKVFSDFYPFLRIEFYRKSHKKYEASEEKDLISSNITVGQVKKTHVSGLLEILPLYKIADVEHEFQQRFGLSVQILRMEKNGWEQTTGMDDFTLKDVNEMGRNSSDEFIMEEYEEDIEEGKEP